MTMDTNVGQLVGTESARIRTMTVGFARISLITLIIPLATTLPKKVLNTWKRKNWKQETVKEKRAWQKYKKRG